MLNYVLKARDMKVYWSEPVLVLQGSVEGEFESVMHHSKSQTTANDQIMIYDEAVAVSRRARVHSARVPSQPLRRWLSALPDTIEALVQRRAARKAGARRQPSPRPLQRPHREAAPQSMTQTMPQSISQRQSVLQSDPHVGRWPLRLSTVPLID